MAERYVKLTEEQALLVRDTLIGAVEQLWELRHTEPAVPTVVAAYNQVLDAIKAQLASPSAADAKRLRARRGIVKE